MVYLHFISAIPDHQLQGIPKDSTQALVKIPVHNKDVSKFLCM